MIYPFFTDIGKMKVSEALPLLNFIASDYKLNFTLVPENPNEKRIHLAVWRNNHLKIAEHILRNSQRNN